MGRPDIFNADGVLVQTQYDTFEERGVTVLVVSGTLSLVGVIAMVAVSIAAVIRARKAPSSQYPMAHIGVFFGSLLVANLLQAIGGIMNSQWLSYSGARLGTFCSAQAGIKQSANLGNALWSLMLAYHAFTVLFLRWKPKRYSLYLVPLCIWTVVLLIVIIPVSVLRDKRHPYYGISGYWCWITEDYPVHRFLLEYLFMFFSGGVSFVLYVLTFLRLRGNIHGAGWGMRFRWVKSDEAWQLQLGRDIVDVHMLKVASHLIWYPFVYTILLIPIAAARIAEYSGHDFSFEATIFSGTLFTLNGFFNAVIFLSTRRLLPEDGSLPTVTMKRQQRQPLAENGVVPFILPPMSEAEQESIHDGERHGNLAMSRQTTQHTDQTFDSRAPLQRGPPDMTETDLTQPMHFSRGTGAS